MISEYARRVLNDPERIRRRDIWFDRMADVFDSRPNEYNDRYLFTIGGRTWTPPGGFKETETLTPRDMKWVWDSLVDSLPRLGKESWNRRLDYFRDMTAASRAVDTRDGTRIEVRPLVYTQPERWMEECLEVMAQGEECRANRFAPDLAAVDLYGVHFIDKLFGANVYFKDGQWNAEYLRTPVGELEFPDLARSGPWSLVKRAADAFLEAGVKAPLFAMPTLSSPLNILVNLYGQEGLLAMIEDQEAARHDLKVINDLIRALHRWFREHIPTQQLQCVASDGRAQPPGAGQLCGCTTQLLSGEMYREFIMPLDDALLGDYSRGGMIHLCGTHTQHIPAFRDMKHLRALQVNDRASWDLEAYLKGLRDDQVVYVCPCPEMPVEKILEVSGGRRVVLVGAEAPEKKGTA